VIDPRRPETDARQRETNDRDLRIDPTPSELGTPVDESRDVRKKRTRFSRQACPKCHSATLERRHLPMLLRPFRIVPGLKPRSYRCQSCRKTITMWKNSD
jgi:predicted RNA-binding Zn-ribbon protein involved in translation (DUF1610 family)